MPKCNAFEDLLSKHKEQASRESKADDLHAENFLAAHRPQKRQMLIFYVGVNSIMAASDEPALLSEVARSDAGLVEEHEMKDFFFDYAVLDEPEESEIFVLLEGSSHLRVAANAPKAKSASLEFFVVSLKTQLQVGREDRRDDAMSLSDCRR